ncbi:MAG TPA: carbohydrate kinase family protein [Roseiflexaceae bacterium]|nr:carbohydrate kinase family protein [Roseiflexaceae bacterium]HMP38839.1 carbohydrate kinase family protein [Roseiflexaceae bacterium]
MRYDVLVVGELNADLILRGDVEPAWGQAEKLLDDATLTLGSSSAIFACGIARLGLKVAFAGLIGDDMLGRFCRDALADRGVDVGGVVVDPAQRTGMTVILQRPDDRAMLTFAGAMAHFGAAHISTDMLRTTRHVHVGSYYMQPTLQPDLPAIFAMAQQAGATTSLDTNWDPAGTWAGLDTLLPVTSCFIPNEGEALAIAGTLAGTPPANVDAALDILAGRVSLAAVKCGANRAIAASGDARADIMPPRVAFVDAVGAGDTFNAGFVYGMLAGWDLADCLRLAVACGSLSTRAAGGTAAQPTLDEALAAG